MPAAFTACSSSELACLRPQPWLRSAGIARLGLDSAAGRVKCQTARHPSQAALLHTHRCSLAAASPCQSQRSGAPRLDTWALRTGRLRHPADTGLQPSGQGCSCIRAPGSLGDNLNSHTAACCMLHAASCLLLAWCTPITCRSSWSGLSSCIAQLTTLNSGHHADAAVCKADMQNRTMRTLQLILSAGLPKVRLHSKVLHGVCMCLAHSPVHGHLVPLT